MENLFLNLKKIKTLPIHKKIPKSKIYCVSILM